MNINSEVFGSDLHPMLPGQIPEPLSDKFFYYVGGTQERWDALISAGVYPQSGYPFDLVLDLWSDAAVPGMIALSHVQL